MWKQCSNLLRSEFINNNSLAFHPPTRDPAAVTTTPSVSLPFLALAVRLPTLFHLGIAIISSFKIAWISRSLHVTYGIDVGYPVSVRSAPRGTCDIIRFSKISSTALG
jgi:hypothetical protein